MCQKDMEVCLGFTADKVPVGTHMCLIFTDEEERRESMLKFLLNGLQTGERTACFTSHLDETTLADFLGKHGISYAEEKKKNAISVSGTRDVYFQNGPFDPDMMLKTLRDFYKGAVEQGFSAARVIGEMIPEIEHIAGGDRLLEYESKVTLLLRQFPVTSVCQYDANSFDGATIMEVLKVHPKMIVNGSVINNPFFIDPETYLAAAG